MSSQIFLVLLGCGRFFQKACAKRLIGSDLETVQVNTQLADASYIKIRAESHCGEENAIPFVYFHQMIRVVVTNLYVF